MIDDLLAIEMINRIWPGGISLQQYAFGVFLLLVVTWIVSILIGSLIPLIIAFIFVGVSILYIAVKAFETVPEATSRNEIDI